MSETHHYDLFPPRRSIEQFLQEVDVHLEETPFWQYYDTGLFGKLHQLVFRTRHNALHRFLDKTGFKPKRALDIGCGCMITAFGLLSRFDMEYVGLDVKPSSELRKYRALIKKDAKKDLDVVRASAENLPFRKGTFDLMLAFDILEHLENPEAAMTEPIRVATRNAIFVVSIPLEKLFHKAARIFGNFLIRKPCEVKQSAPYHYASGISSYEKIVSWLRENYRVAEIAYTPFGLAPISINGILFSYIVPTGQRREGFTEGQASKTLLHAVNEQS